MGGRQDGRTGVDRMREGGLQGVCIGRLDLIRGGERARVPNTRGRCAHGRTSGRGRDLEQSKPKNPTTIPSTQGQGGGGWI